LFKDGDKKLVDLKEASIWASEYLNRKVTVSNISYLIQYGRIKKYRDEGNPLVDINERQRAQNMFIDYIHIKASLFLN